MKIMPNLLVCFIVFNISVLKAQMSLNHINPLLETQISNTATIPDYALKNHKIIITGTIYESDGVTPAKNVVLTISHADEDGNFDLRKKDDKDYLYHKATIKTDVDGNYYFYTFIPGNDRRFNQLQEIFLLAKTEQEVEFIMPTLLFDQDPLLTKRCRKRITKNSDLSHILKPKKVDGLLKVKHDIILSSNFKVI